MRIQPTWLLTISLLLFILPTCDVLGTPGDENWDNSFSSISAAGEVYGLAQWKSKVVAVGNFLTAGGAKANKVAQWDGTTWSGFNTKIAGNQGPRYVAGSTSNFFVAGFFSSIGGTNISNLAQTDGTNWSGVGTGLNISIAQALIAVNDVLYIAGQLNLNGTNTSIAAWDGATWKSLGYCSGLVYTISINGNEVYAGGTFTNIGGVAATNIAKWDGTNWASLGAGLNGVVRCLTVANDTVYAGGDFTSDGNGVQTRHVAIWDGNTWAAMDMGFDARVYALAFHQGALYAGGAFNGLLAQWNGASWNSVGNLSGHSVLSLFSSGEDLYVGGSFESVDGDTVNSIARYDAAGWHGIGGGISYGRVNTLRTIGNSVYAGGEFGLLAGTSANSIARFDGTNWNSIGAGVNLSEYVSPVYDLAVANNATFAGGKFDSVDGPSASDILKWNGINWSLDATNFLWSFGSSSVNAMATIGTNLYAAGSFSSVSPSLRNIARWNGQAWQSLGISSGTSDFIYALAVVKTNLYVGGFFSLPTQNLYRWTGTQLGSIGSPSGPVYTMASSDTNLFIGGFFSSVQSISCSNVARWNGINWTPLGTGVNGIVRAIATQGSTVFVGGDFTQAGGIPANHIAKWDGTNWYSLGSGIDGGEFPTVRSLAVWQNKLFVGGNFSSAGSKSSYYLAVWNMQAPTLQITSLADQFMLAWPADSKTYVLQQASELSSNAWTDVEQSPTLSNSVYSIALPASETKLFRLRP